MKLDKYGLLVSELLPDGDSGNVEDSCANTSRYLLLYDVDMLASRHRLQCFVKDNKYIRHPDSKLPDSDMSWDQIIPWLVACYKYEAWDLIYHFMTNLEDNKYRLNGKAYPNLLALTVFKRVLGHRNSLWDLPLLLQALVMKYVPWRWDDERKTFYSSKGSTADYLNYSHVLTWAHRLKPTLVTRLCYRIISKYVMLDNIVKYFKPDPPGKQEPNVDSMLNAYGYFL